MIFIVTLSVDIAFITFFGNVWPALGATLLMILVVWLRSWHQKSRLGGRGIGVVASSIVPLFALFVSVGSVFWAQKDTSSGTGKEIYIGTGEITERQSSGRYLFRSFSGETFLYYTSQSDYQPGDILFANGSLQRTIGERSLFLSPPFSALRERAQEVTNEERGFDKNKRLIMHGWAGILYEKQAVLLSVGSPTRAASIRKKLVGGLQRFYNKRDVGLTLGMLVGDRSSITQEDYASFISSGLVHIIAVSGGNIILLISFLSALLFFLPYYIRLVCVSIAIAIYAYLCGFDSSVVRAVAMALLSIGAVFLGRSLSIRRSIQYVYVCMLVWNPYYLLYDLGFIFSFSAIVGLVFFSERWKLSTTKKIWQGSVGESIRQVAKSFRNVSIMPSIAASLGISAPLLFFTGRVNLLSILSNIAVVPLVPFVMIYGFLSALFYTVVPWQLIALPQDRVISRIYLVNARGVEHALYVVAMTGWARCFVVVLMIVISSIIMIARKRIV